MRTTGGKETKTGFEEKKDSESNGSDNKGQLTIVGIGPGDREHLSQKALDAIMNSAVIVGYGTYIKLIDDLVVGKEVISTGMTHEIERAKIAIEKALSGKRVSFISSGDPGVYGMAGLALELLSDEDRESIDVEVVPGIIAATTAASLLGAPLMHDFAAISLSDLLTELELIEKRIEFAAKADFVIAIYNPKSKRRIKPFERACDILLSIKSPDTPVGIVRNAGRGTSDVIITTLKDLKKNETVDMVTTIIIGNSTTYVKGGHMITPRGYASKMSD
ncbi:precorrin-3B C(17)-methyltransferase [Thermodesulfobacteriota bacterium]